MSASFSVLPIPTCLPHFPLLSPLSFISIDEYMIILACSVILFGFVLQCHHKYKHDAMMRDGRPNL